MVVVVREIWASVAGLHYTETHMRIPNDEEKWVPADPMPRQAWEGKGWGWGGGRWGGGGGGGGGVGDRGCCHHNGRRKNEEPTEVCQNNRQREDGGRVGQGEKVAPWVLGEKGGMVGENGGELEGVGEKEPRGR